MKKYFLCCLITALYLQGGAQGGYHFSSQNSVGLLEGANGSSLQFLTVNGVSHKRFFAGLGTGLDYYYIRSLPLFLSLQSHLTGNKRTPFITLDGGVNYPWTLTERDRWNDFITDKFNPKFFWASGLGYKIGLKNGKDALLLHIGYSYKHIQEVQTQPTVCVTAPCPAATETFDYRLNRLSIRFGWQL
jgi:hypothetical protein